MIPDRPKARLKTKLPALLAALIGANLILAAAIFGPNLALGLYLDHLLPRQTGQSVSYAFAEINLNRRTLILRDLSLAGEELGRLTLTLALTGFSPLNLLWARPGLDLGEALILQGVHWEREGWTLSAPEVSVLKPRWPKDEADLPFNLISLYHPRGQGLPEAPQFQLKSLVLSAQELTLEDLTFQTTTDSGAWAGEIKSLSLDDYKTTLSRWIESEGRPLSLLPELFHLKIDSARLSLDGRPALWVKTALPEPKYLFTKFSPDSISYSYFLELILDPSVPEGPFWSSLAGLIDRPLELELTLDLTFDPPDQALLLRSLNLESLNLGCLDLALEVSGLGPPEDSGLLAALIPARLHSLSLAFQDQGFMAEFYDWLARTEGWTQDEISDRLREKFLDPLLEMLASDTNPPRLPSLAAEAEAFLARPENLILSAEPAQPLALARLAALSALNRSPALARLVKTDKYAIIEEMGLTLTVNDRPSVPLAAAPGILPETATAQE